MEAAARDSEPKASLEGEARRRRGPGADRGRKARRAEIDAHRRRQRGMERGQLRREPGGVPCLRRRPYRTAAACRTRRNACINPGRQIAAASCFCADESVHTADGLDAIASRYQAINIKLDKAGGLTAALHLKAEALERGLAIMVGCMVGTSLAMAPALLLASDADFVDLDGPLLLSARPRAGTRVSGQRDPTLQRRIVGLIVIGQAAKAFACMAYLRLDLRGGLMPDDDGGATNAASRHTRSYFGISLCSKSRRPAWRPRPNTARRRGRFQ